MDNLPILLISLVLTVFAFFVAAPCFLNMVSTFGVQKRFAEAMIAEGVVKPEDVKMRQGKKQVAGVIVTAVVLAATVFTSTRVPLGYVCAGVGFVAGLLKYRAVLAFNSLTVQRFKNTYNDVLDAKKLNKYVDQHF